MPYEIREELLRQERLEVERRARDEEGPNETAAVRPVTARNVAANFLQQFEAAINSGTPVSRSTKLATPSVAKRPLNRDSMQLLDKSGITSLLRLIFIPEPCAKTTLNHVLTNLCENSKTRAELLTILLSILEDGIHDLASVDKGLAELSLKNDKSQRLKIGTPIVDDSNMPNLVAQRCLESLTLLVTSGSSSSRYFLTEHDRDNSAKTPKSSKKGKEKERLNVPNHIPAVALLKLLQRPAFLQNSAILEQLMNLLSNVLRPLSIIAKKKHAQAQQQESLELKAEHSKSLATPDAIETPLKEKAEKPEIKLPAIPTSVVQYVVNVLKDGICSLKTFQNTLHCIQYLSSYPEHKIIINDQLLESAQKVATEMVPSFNELIKMLKSSDSSTELNSQILTPYAAPSADQAKLLRILKTIDFLNKTSPDEAGKKKDDINTTESAHERLRSIYDKLNITILWQKLGESMALIEQKEGFIHVGTVLLPIIEAFMVVAKPYVHIKKSHPASLVKQTSELVEEDQGGFIKFTEDHRRILNTMVRNNPSLMNGSFSLLVQNPKVLEFDNKRTYFTQQLHKRNGREYNSLQINVRRAYVFEDSYHQLQGKSGNEIKYGKLNVRFHEEDGVDAGGVTREWFSVLARQMFNPNYALFIPAQADKVTYQPNRASGINPDHLSYFKFVGRIIGKAIYDGRLLDAYFTRSFYKCIIGTPVDYKDIEAVDPEFHKSLEWILQNDITDILDLTFSTEVDDFGRLKIVDLKPNGRTIAVTEENKVEYVRLVSEQRLVLAIKEQIQAFLSGFHDVVPKELVKIFNEQELELLISGMPDIDIDDWKNNTEYQNYTSSSPQIQWFWRAVRSFSQEERAKLIQFATGTSKVPLEGFAHLQGSSGLQKFQIHKEFSSTTRLPSAHTWYSNY